MRAAVTRTMKPFSAKQRRNDIHPQENVEQEIQNTFRLNTWAEPKRNHVTRTMSGYLVALMNPSSCPTPVSRHQLVRSSLDERDDIDEAEDRSKHGDRSDEILPRQDSSPGPHRILDVDPRISTATVGHAEVFPAGFSSVGRNTVPAKSWRLKELAMRRELSEVCILFTALGKGFSFL